MAALVLVALLPAIAGLAAFGIYERRSEAAWPQTKALAHIKNGAGSHFDPKVVEVFLRMRW